MCVEPCIIPGSLGTNSIPHLGQLSGVSLIISGCIVQAYFVDDIIVPDVSVKKLAEEFSLLVPPEHAANTNATIESITMFFSSFLFSDK